MAECPAKHQPKVEPAHPSEILRADPFPAIELTVAEAARQLRVSRQNLHSILAGRTAVSPQMTVRLGRSYDNGGGFCSACRPPTSCGTPSARLLTAA